MGMKASSGFFRGTSGYLKYKLDIQYFAQGKRSIKARLLLKLAKNEKLKSTIKELYRPGATIGDGGTAAAIKKELKTGVLVGGKNHIQKGKERIRNLQNLINSNKLSGSDKKIAAKLKKDLEKVIGGK